MMTRETSWKVRTAGLALIAMLAPAIAVAQAAPKAPLTVAEKMALLQQKVKYVFIIFQENRSFDHYFGTFPGANGLFSQPAAQTPGFTQPIVDTDGTLGTISAFKIPQTVHNTTNNATVALYPEDIDTVDHSHTGMNNSMHFNAGNVAANDVYALNEEKLMFDNQGQIVSQATGSTTFAPPSLMQKQRGELVMGHLDCDTIPFLWQYADRFALYDNFRQTVIGPSTPNAIAMIAGQSGVTQWALHSTGGNATVGGAPGGATGSVPLMGDPGPFAGSNRDTSAMKPPYNAADENPATPTLNQTYASLPLSFMGKTIDHTILFDQNPALDLIDVRNDIATISANAGKPVNWRWYEEGYDLEPTDSNGVALHGTYIVHHEGPQYFGYIGDNTVEQQNLRGLNDFFVDMTNHALPDDGGVFYIRGGYGNNDNLLPRDPDANVQAHFKGGDDHPGYSDSQISEAQVADAVNAIASSPYWPESAIIITYDETDGLYDHVSPDIRQLDPQGHPLSGGPRIPAIVISPYGVQHRVIHTETEHGSVIKFIDALFKLTPLADLPDERNGKAMGAALNAGNLAPSDGADTPIGDLTDAFDDDRLLGALKPIPASYALIPATTVHALPHYNGQGCQILNIVPTDYVDGTLIDPAPADFNPRPTSNPGTPATDAMWPAAGN